MDRRTFLQTTLAASLAPALPAMPLAPTAAPKMGIAARYWASYFATPQGHAALQAAQSSGVVSLAEAKALVMRSVATGGYSPAVAAVNTISAGRNIVKPAVKLPQRLTRKVFDDVPEPLRNLRKPITCDCEHQVEDMPQDMA